MLDPDDHRVEGTEEEQALKLKRLSSVGQVLDDVEVRVVDEDGNPVEAGTLGEVQLRTFRAMDGYWGNEEKTRVTVDDEGWVHTGDLGYLDEDDYLFLGGRTGDMIIRGGENVYPREIEEFLYTHPKVADVQVIGVPDERFVEEVMAWVMLKPGEKADDEEIREFCKGKIAHYKIPRYIKMATEFPMTVTGKLQKFKMREIAIAELGLHNA